MKIYLIRHGESEGNAQELFIGAEGKYSLTDIGREQAKRAANVLGKYDLGSTFALYTSPVERALETAGIVSDELSINYIKDDRLSEIDLGELEGLSKETVDDKYEEVIRSFSEKPSECEIPGGESIIQVQQRVLSFVYDRLDEGRDLVLVTHDIVIRTFLVHAMSMSVDFIWSLSPSELMSGEQSEFEYGDADIPLGSLSIVNYGNGEFEVESIGLT